MTGRLIARGLGARREAVRKTFACWRESPACRALLALDP